MRELLERRKATQPIGEWSCGSVFTNPPGDHAARLVEASGLKGFRIGDASVSEKHANFIINHGNATAEDLERLIRHVQETVERMHGVRLTSRSAGRGGGSLMRLQHDRQRCTARDRARRSSAGSRCCSAAIPPSARFRC